MTKKKVTAPLESVLHPDDGRISVEDLCADLRATAAAEYEASREVREALASKKRKAVGELIALGISEQSACLLANHYEDGSQPH